MLSEQNDSMLPHLKVTEFWMDGYSSLKEKSEGGEKHKPYLAYVIFHTDTVLSLLNCISKSAGSISLDLSYSKRCTTCIYFRYTTLA